MGVLDLDQRTITDVVRRLVSGSGPDVRTYAAGRVEWSSGAREAYSYGSHFPLFRYVPRAGRVPALFVINGDRWGGSRTRTPDHQDQARRAIAASGVRSVVIPFSALDGAGIVIDSIRPLDVRTDSTWTETVARRSLAEVPLWRRRYTVPVERTAANLAEVPAGYRHVWRAPIAGEYPSLFLTWTGAHSNRPLLAGPDGLYRWQGSETRTVKPDPDGLYRWDETRHRLGDALFTAERVIVETRPAHPFERESATARETVTLGAGRGSYCAATNGPHEAGPGGACIGCDQPLAATVTYRRRARYLSSFDYNEPAPLYFLCEVPRTGFPTVDGAIDSLAPPAVHSATLAGREVRRQGDIFLVDTNLTRENLAARGATFGRFTLWSRGAKPRAGEITYRAPNRAHDARVAAREVRWARQEWRASYRAALDRATVAHIPDRDEQREANRAEWRELLDRQRAETTAATLAGVDVHAPYSATCDVCGAGPGIECHRLPPECGPALAGKQCGRERSRRETPLVDGHRRQRADLARDTRVDSPNPPLPHTAPGARYRWRQLQDRRTGEIAAATVALRRAILAGPGKYRTGTRWNESATAYRRRRHAESVIAARRRLDRALAPATDNAGHTGRRHARDVYRHRYGSNALALWTRATSAAQERYRPETVESTARARADRETVRRFLAIYGTAHTATEIARVGTAVYVRGTVRHAVDLETGRRGGPDHRPVILTPDRWYLAVRNSVPRQNRRRRRQRTGRNPV
jgi:hypothetical protein